MHWDSLAGVEFLLLAAANWARLNYKTADRFGARLLPLVRFGSPSTGFAGGSPPLKSLTLLEPPSPLEKVL